MNYYQVMLLVSTVISLQILLFGIVSEIRLFDKNMKLVEK